MKFPRNARIFRGHLDAAPLAGVFFLLVMFLALSSNLVFTPGISVNLPQGGDLPGTDKQPVVVSVDAGGLLYFEYQIVTEKQLRERLSNAVKSSREPLTLVVEGDKEVKYDVLVRLSLLAAQAGIKEALWATRPPTFSPRPSPVFPP